MMGSHIEISVIVICVGILFFLSMVESAVTLASPLVLRMMMEHLKKPRSPLLSMVLENKMHVMVPVHLGIQVCLIVVAVLSTHLSMRRWPVEGLLCSFAAVVVVSVLFRQLLPKLFTQNEPERKLIKLLKIYGPFYGVLHLLALPVSGLLKLHKRMHEEIEEGDRTDNEEATDEEIQAYLDIGEDEGILQEEDSQLIQSVVAFGNTLVREVMTPRTKIVACDEKVSIAELRNTMVQWKHSRIPVYRDDMDHIVGIVYIRQLMAACAEGKETDSIAGLVNPVLSVPGTKPVSKLLKELQARGDHAAVVIDEFGGVAGLVTIEDLVEEIIGEIRDEDEAKVSKIIEEGPGSFVIRGSTELWMLEDRVRKKFGDFNCSTVGGLIMSFLGRVPSPGEAFDYEGLNVRILDADRRRVYWIRVQFQEPEAAKTGAENEG
ncbi:MAG: HlyC/CorC family transporter [Acidobacteria bacterium]|nr:HlyC/CorC family transporter [Acidobacteriota bacterium]